MPCSILSDDTLTTTNAYVTNLSVTYADIVNCSVLDLNYVTVTNVSLMYYYGNVSAMNACMFITDIVNASVSNLLATNFSASNSSFTRVSVDTTLNAVTASLQNLSAVSACITNGSFVNVSITNAYLDTLTVGGQLYTGSSGGNSGNDASFVNACITYLLSETASFSSLNVLTTLSADSITGLTSVLSSTAYFDNACVTNASLASVLIDTASITTASLCSVVINTASITNCSIATVSFVDSFARVAVMTTGSITNDGFIGGSLNVCGNIYANHGFYTDFITVGYSDDQLKTRLGNLTGCVEGVQTLNAFTYEPQQWACERYGFVSNVRYGLSAQEVQAVFPNAVKPAAFDKTYLSLDYDMLVPVLVQCIQELHTRLSVLENK